MNNCAFSNNRPGMRPGMNNNFRGPQGVPGGPGPVRPNVRPDMGNNCARPGSPRPDNRPGQNPGCNTGRPDNRPGQNPGCNTARPDNRPGQNSGCNTARPDNRPGQNPGCGTGRPDNRPGQNPGCNTARPDNRPGQNPGCNTARPDNRPGQNPGCSTGGRPPHRDDCECGNSRPNQAQLLNKINEVSFAVNDISLYLNTHPCDQKALDFFRENMEQRKIALKEYAKHFSPLTIDTADDAASDSWTWVTSPWPWEGGIF